VARDGRPPRLCRQFLLERWTEDLVLACPSRRRQLQVRMTPDISTATRLIHKDPA
jgi:hypothetical protein